MRIDENHIQCPKCKGVFAIGDWPTILTYGKRKLSQYCKPCKKVVQKKAAVNAIIKNGIGVKLLEARRKLEEMRDLRESSQ